MDIYAQQVGARLEDVQSFAKYLGGSSCNIAYGCARLGLRSSMLTRVGDEHMGRFIVETLRKGGVDVSHIKVDKKRLSGLVVLGLKDRATFPLIFYRNDCADMAISEDDIAESYIASSESLLITGTHFSTEKTSLACKKAMAYAKKNGVKLILDIDYRPVLWGLTSIDQGEERFIKSDSVSAHLQSFVSDFDLIVGTEEEFQIAGGEPSVIPSLATLRTITKATLVLKRGAEGNSVVEHSMDLPTEIQELPLYKGLKIEVLNVLGAGDAFMSGFLKGWLKGEDYERCSLYANACGALVVSRHGCSPAIPSWLELNFYLKNRVEIKRIDRDEELNFLHKATNRPAKWRDLFILAFDQQSDLEQLVVAEEKFPVVKKFKDIIASAVNELLLEKDHASEMDEIGVIVDRKYGQEVLHDFTGRGIFIASPIEKAGNDFNFELSDGAGSLGSELLTRPQEQVVKCLVKIDFPLSEEKLKAILEKLEALFKDCLFFNREFLLEFLVSQNHEVDDEKLLEIMGRVYELGLKPDWWKLAPKNQLTWQKIISLVETRDEHCQGILLSSTDEPPSKLLQKIVLVKKFPLVKGVVVGENIFLGPIKDFYKKKINEEEAKNKIKRSYKNVIEFWKEN